MRCDESPDGKSVLPVVLVRTALAPLKKWWAPPVKTTLVCHHDDDLDRIAVARWLGSFTDLVGLVIIQEGPAQRRNRIKRELKRVGYFRFLDVLAYRFYHKTVWEKRDRAYERRVLDEVAAKYPPLPASLRTLTTASPNSAETIAFLGALKPDLMIARCKVILKPAVFEGARLGTYVMHPGICPEYRNAHGCFWALAEGDTDKVGMTLLKIDRGIDTGPVYGFFSYDYDELRESHHTIQSRTVFDNLDRLRDKFLEIEQGTAATIDTTGRKSGVWGQPWMTRYLRLQSAARRRASGR
jgi:hypothetical protein